MKEQQEPGYAKKWSETWRSYERNHQDLKKKLLKNLEKLLVSRIMKATKFKQTEIGEIS
jgi:hypothetical protein